MSGGESRGWRIAVLQPSISLVLQGLGRLDAVVACTRYCLEAAPELRGRDLKIVADSWTATEAEILGAAPDLVLASVPYRLESLAAILKAGCPVLTLAPHSLADVFKDMRLLGSLLHASDRAEALIAQMTNTLDETRRTAAAAGTQPLVYCEEWGKPLIHSQPWVAELVEAAGGRFVGTPGAQTRAETVAEADPDVLVFAWCGAGDRVPLERVVEKRGWGPLKAVQSGRVYCIPDEYLNTPAQNLLRGLAALASVLHPELFHRDETVRRLLSGVAIPASTMM